jgi:hypothetical protein
MHTLNFSHFISKAEQGKYLLLPFEMPANAASLRLSYTYERFHQEQIPLQNGSFLARDKVNMVDLGLLAPDGAQVGASGSAYPEIFVSQTSASPGYKPAPLVPGTWQIMLGAYKIAPEGVNVRLELQIESKKQRWLKGDLHVHSRQSDGIHSLEHLARHARAHGLDFIAITDHNQPVKRASFPKIDGFTIIPGQEWTHYLGHSNFLGVEEAYSGAFFANSLAEIQDRFHQARANGALITINHPLESDFGFRIDLEQIPYDLIEVWNGPMRPRNLETIAWWDQMLKSGKKQVATCGSDYHKDTVFERLADPCVNVLAWSDSEEDILEAVRHGRSYFTYSPTPLHALLSVGDYSYGDSLGWEAGLTAALAVQNLEQGDEIRLIDQDGSRTLFSADRKGDLTMEIPILKPGYLRLEIWRHFFSILPQMPALVTNPIWID